MVTFLSARPCHLSNISITRDKKYIFFLFSSYFLFFYSWTYSLIHSFIHEYIFKYISISNLCPFQYHYLTSNSSQVARLHQQHLIPSFNLSLQSPLLIGSFFSRQIIQSQIHPWQRAKNDVYNVFFLIIQCLNSSVYR